MYSFFDGKKDTAYDSVAVDGNNVNLLKDNKIVLIFGDVIDVESFLKTLQK